MPSLNKKPKFFTDFFQGVPFPFWLHFLVCFSAVSLPVSIVAWEVYTLPAFLLLLGSWVLVALLATLLSRFLYRCIVYGRKEQSDDPS